MVSKRTWFSFGSGNASSTAGNSAAVEAVRHHFNERAAQQGYTLGPSQREAIDRLAVRASLLLEPEACFDGRRSLYLHGKVGRGKSWLLDRFFEAIPLPGKRRLHFHGFFADLHAGMFRYQGKDDALERTLDGLLSDCQLLCFDEFHVHDIGDAMLIRRLFSALFARKVLLVVTSNYAPAQLLPHPLYHERFLPVIRLIEAQMEVLEVGGEQDYRRLPGSGTAQRFVTGSYRVNASPDQRRALGVTPGEGILLKVGNRQLSACSSRERRVTFTFSELCEAPTAVMDYLLLCERFDEWVIADLPLLAECSIAVQQRFINLVDVLYDQDKRLTLLSEHPLEQALAASAVDLMRSQSRLSQLRQAEGQP